MHVERATRLSNVRAHRSEARMLRFNTLFKPSVSRDAYKNIAGTLTRHVQSQLAFEIFADAHPLVSARPGLFEVYDVVSCRTVAVLVESEFVAAQTLNVVVYASRL